MAETYTYLTPRDTASILQREADQCDNFGLILGRYLPREVVNNDDIPGQKNKKYRDGWLRGTCDRFTFEDTGWYLLAQQNFTRWRAQTEGALHFQRQLSGRMVVGLGGKGPLEFGITLHPVTGLPYIPGSALKGMTRNYALLVIAAQLGIYDEDADKFNDKLTKLDETIIAGDHDDLDDALVYRYAFGSQGNAGMCVFHDAILDARKKLDGPLFTVDVMTPHFKDYYGSSGDKPPADNDSPNPVSFVTVSAGAYFYFAVGGRRDADDAVVRWASDWTKAALVELGIGSKTASGYGVFKPKPKKKKA